MGTPFRDHHLSCPACPEAMLREYETRFVCDACHGMLVELPDLGGAIRDLTGVLPALAFFADRPGKRTCPRCPTAMTACRLRITLEDKAIETKPTVDRCEHHGVWFDAEELADVFARVRKKFLPRGSGGMGGGGGAGWGHTIGGSGTRTTWWPGA
jgi:hypothetical protein